MPILEEPVNSLGAFVACRRVAPPRAKRIPAEGSPKSSWESCRTVDLSTRARVQAHRLSSVLAVHEGVPRAMDHHSSGCLPAEKFPTCASGRQGRGATTLSDFRRQFHLLTRLRDVAGGRITGIRGW